MPTGARQMFALVFLGLVVCSRAIQQTQASGPGEFAVSLPAPPKEKGPISKVIGWQLKVENDETPVTLGKIRGHGSVAAWNEAHPDQSIAPGDQVVEVNGVRWNSNSKEFADGIAKQFVASRERGEGMSLVLRRRAEDVQLSRSAEKAGEKVEHQRQAQEGEAGAAAAPEDSQKSTAAAEEVARTAMKIEGLVSAWNKVHPEDGIDTTTKHFSDALAVLIRKASAPPAHS